MHDAPIDRMRRDVLLAGHVEPAVRGRNDLLTDVAVGAADVDVRARVVRNEARAPPLLLVAIRPSLRCRRIARRRKAKQLHVLVLGQRTLHANGTLRPELQKQARQESNLQPPVLEPTPSNAGVGTNPGTDRLRPSSP